MYQVGFGDCLLLSLSYRRPLPDGRDERHILFDFGSTRAPERGRRVLPQAAELLEQHTDGRLDVLVATHRHKDHISGFGDDETAAVIDRLRPGLVVRPWTDDPDAAGRRDGACAPLRLAPLRRRARGRAAVRRPRRLAGRGRRRPLAAWGARGARSRPAAERAGDREPRALGRRGRRRVRRRRR